MASTRARFVVHGLVQGVGFRFATEAEATRLGLSGYVRNLPTGEVEVEAEGDVERLDRLAVFLAEGPRGARVDRVERSEVAPTGETGFGIRR